MDGMNEMMCIASLLRVLWAYLDVRVLAVQEEVFIICRALRAFVCVRRSGACPALAGSATAGTMQWQAPGLRGRRVRAPPSCYSQAGLNTEPSHVQPIPP